MKRNEATINGEAIWGGSLGALRAYQAYHPDAAIYDVTYRGRTVWMTSKQRAIWHEVGKYWMRGKRDSMQRIADQCHCSKATVSRFLARLDQWRFIDLLTFPGHGGGTYVFTRREHEPPRIWTKAARFAARQLLAAMYKRHAAYRALQERINRQPMPAPARIRLNYQEAFFGEPVLLGNTGATLTRQDRYGSRHR